LVDASDSKSGIRKDVQVRFLFRAQSLQQLLRVFLFNAGLSVIKSGLMLPLYQRYLYCFLKVVRKDERRMDEG
ncbi:MAG: hypothetical protein ACM3H8_03860, partial [Sphingobacteriales bacterium]